jgi:1-deoxy-D-xylulose-5-phosphate synthase
MLRDAMHLADGGPVAIRYPRGQARNVGEHEVGVGVRARRVVAAEGDATSAVCILAVGRLVEAAEKAADLLVADGIPTTVWDVRCCAPLVEDMLADAARHGVVVTCEDGVRDGGIGMAMEDRIGDLDATTPVAVLGLPTRFLTHEARAERLLGQLGLDAPGIAAAARRLR